VGVGWGTGFRPQPAKLSTTPAQTIARVRATDANPLNGGMVDLQEVTVVLYLAIPMPLRKPESRAGSDSPIALEPADRTQATGTR
jgi:hypothetical protein